MATIVQPPSTGPKFSRYRSVRKPREQPSSPPPPLHAFAAAQDGGLDRNLSRYRSIRTAPTVPVVPSNENILKPAGPDHLLQPSNGASPYDTTQKPQRYYASTKSTNPSTTRNGVKLSESTSLPSSERRKPSQSHSLAAHHGAGDAVTARGETPRRARAHTRTEQEQERAAQAEKLKVEQAEKLKAAANQERMLQAQMNRQVKRSEAVGQQPTSEAAERSRLRKRRDTEARETGALALKSTDPRTAPAVSPVRDRFGLFKRKKGNEVLPSTVALATKATPIAIVPPLANANGPPTIRPGGGGVVPGKDAPVSAVNAGERRVRIECNKSSIVLPVTPTTTSVDLIRSAANCLTEPINSRASVLMELFVKVGVQRPLRRYEHVRDVLNSWDDDMQNSLVLVSSGTDSEIEALDARSVPTQPPEETSYYLYHSQKPGKWDKKWICLRSDGQVVAAKNETSRDAVNICHMTDFDIYTPTERQKVKKIKPPRRYCYGIKSQQKSSMFESTANFIHFFSTNDKGVAEAWYRATQRWRSWYLVHVMGEGPQKSGEGASQHAKPAESRRPSSRERPQTGQSSSSKDSHYQLGSFRPLIDMDQLQPRRISETKIPSPTQAPAPINIHPSQDTKAIHARNMSMRSRAPPPVSFPKRLSNDPDSATDLVRKSGPSLAVGTHQPPIAATREVQPIVNSGLLGRQHSQRNKVLRDREEAAKHEGPFIAGPSLLNNASSDIPVRSRASLDEGSRPYRMASIGERQQSTELRRSSSVTRREKLKPLVDLTPEYPEPPQHWNKGKGFIPEQVGSGGLIDSATSPEMPYYIPPSTDWRGRNALAAGRPTTARVELTSTVLPMTTGNVLSRVTDANLSRTRSVRPRDVIYTGAKIEGAVESALTAPSTDSEAFTNGHTLLAESGSSQGASAIGKGVVSGNSVDAGLRRGNTIGRIRPLVDLSAGSKFAKGSLLDQTGSGAVREGLQGIAPIDRTKTRSFEIVTGERV